MAKRLKPRQIMIGCDERSERVMVTDQKTLRDIAAIEALIPGPAFKQDDDITPVIFRKYGPRRGGEVIALFPAEANDKMRSEICSSYVHVGQHGAANPQIVINQTRAAKPEEYADLKRELESAPYGYRLKVYTRMQRSFGEARREMIAAWERNDKAMV